MPVLFSCRIEEITSPGLTMLFFLIYNHPGPDRDDQDAP